MIMIFDILEQSSFQKYTTCWVFLALSHLLYLCICVFVFVYLCMRHLEISVLISLDQELSENVWFIWSKTSNSGDVTMRDGRTTTNDDEQGKIMLLSLWMLEGWVSQFVSLVLLCSHQKLISSFKSFFLQKKSDKVHVPEQLFCLSLFVCWWLSS